MALCYGRLNRPSDLRAKSSGWLKSNNKHTKKDEESKRTYSPLALAAVVNKTHFFRTNRIEFIYTSIASTVCIVCANKLFYLLLLLFLLNRKYVADDF